MFQQPHRFRAARPRSPSHPLERAQKLALRALSASVLGFGAGGLRLDPVAALYFARPLAVSPAPLDTGSFSPRPTLRLGLSGIAFKGCVRVCLALCFSQITAGKTCPLALKLVTTTCRRCPCLSTERFRCRRRDRHRRTRTRRPRVPRQTVRRRHGRSPHAAPR